MKSANTNADLNTTEQALQLPRALQRYGADWSNVTPFSFSDTRSTIDLIAADMDGDGDLDLIEINRNETRLACDSESIHEFRKEQQRDLRL